ncbi:MAG: metallopeptidase TldD-related protein [Eubacteriales bacterium]|nr:metallopeptidase TldD-related protein [Eubacteriales bacterium]
MIRETYEVATQETSFSVVQSRIDSIRQKNITRTGYRVYQDGLIGVHGQLGQSTDDPWQKAAENLSGQVAYPFEPVRGINQEKTVASDLDGQAILPELEAVLAEARKRHPEFIISNKINITETTTTLQNDQQTKLVHRDKTLMVGLILKHKDSVSIMDTFLGYRARHWDAGFFLDEFEKMTAAYNTQVPFPEDELLVVTEPDLLASKLVTELNGEKVGYKSSLLNKDFGKKVFHDDFTFYLDWDEKEQYHVPFFDAEGTIIPEGRVDLVRAGVIEKAYTDRRTADKFQMPLTGSAACPYDGVPTLGARNFNMARSPKTVRELLGGRLGVVIVMASGGDYTEDGNFATPVQLGLLTDGTRLLGRLPEFDLSGRLYDIFGKDYIGYSQDRFLAGEHALVVKMKIGRKS